MIPLLVPRSPNYTVMQVQITVQIKESGVFEYHNNYHSNHIIMHVCLIASIKLLRTKPMVQHWNDYHYPMWFMNITALLETAGVIGVVAGLWIPEILKYAAGLFVVLMIGAIHAHLFRAKHKPVMTINALVMLLLSITLMVV